MLATLKEGVSSMSKKKGPDQKERLAYSPQEAADILGLSNSTVERMIRSGTVRTVKIRARRIIPVTEIEKLLAAAV
jgi:excisionase family DNA binding protein